MPSSASDPGRTQQDLVDVVLVSNEGEGEAVGSLDHEMIEGEDARSSDRELSEGEDVGSSDDESSDNPPINRHVYRTLIAFNDFISNVSKDVNYYGVTYSIPDRYAISIPSKDDRMHLPPRGCLTIFTGYFSSGLRFPIPVELANLLRSFNICPTQLCPNTYSLLISFIFVNRAFGEPSSASELQKLFSLRLNKIGGDRGFYYLSALPSKKYLANNRTGFGKTWKSKYLYIRESYAGEFNFSREWRTDQVSISPNLLEPKWSPGFSYRLLTHRFNIALLVDDEMLSASGFSSVPYSGNEDFATLVMAHQLCLDLICQEIDAANAADLRLRRGRTGQRTNSRGGKKGQSSFQATSDAPDAVDLDQAFAAASIGRRPTGLSIQEPDATAAAPHARKRFSSSHPTTVEEVAHERSHGKRRVHDAPTRGFDDSFDPPAPIMGQHLPPPPPGIPPCSVGPSYVRAESSDSYSIGGFRLTDEQAMETFKNLWPSLNRDLLFESQGPNRLIRQTILMGTTCGGLVQTLCEQMGILVNSLEQPEELCKNLRSANNANNQAKEMVQKAVATAKAAKEAKKKAEDEAKQSRSEAKKAKAHRNQIGLLYESSEEQAMKLAEELDAVQKELAELKLSTDSRKAEAYQRGLTEI